MRPKYPGMLTCRRPEHDWWADGLPGVYSDEAWSPVHLMPSGPGQYTKKSESIILNAFRRYRNIFLMNIVFKFLKPELKFQDHIKSQNEI